MQGWKSSEGILVTSRARETHLQGSQSFNSVRNSTSLKAGKTPLYFPAFLFCFSLEVSINIFPCLRKREQPPTILRLAAVNLLAQLNSWWPYVLLYTPFFGRYLSPKRPAACLAENWTTRAQRPWERVSMLSSWMESRCHIVHSQGRRISRACPGSYREDNPGELDPAAVNICEVQEMYIALGGLPEVKQALKPRGNSPEQRPSENWVRISGQLKNMYLMLFFKW